MKDKLEKIVKQGADKQGVRGIGSALEAQLGLPDMATAPPYQEKQDKITIPGKEGGDNTGLRTNHLMNKRSTK